MFEIGKAEVEEVSGWFSFEDLFEVNIAYEPMEDLKKALDSCTKTVYIKHQETKKFDEEKALKYLADLILSWKGLTVRKVATKLIPVKFDPADGDQEVPCTDANKIELLKKAYGFDEFIRGRASDLSSYEEQRREVERKNSGSMPDGGPPEDRTVNSAES